MHLLDSFMSLGFVIYILLLFMLLILWSVEVHDEIPP